MLWVYLSPNTSSGSLFQIATNLYVEKPATPVSFHSLLSYHKPVPSSFGLHTCWEKSSVYLVYTSSSESFRLIKKSVDGLKSGRFVHPFENKWSINFSLLIRAGFRNVQTSTRCAPRTCRYFLLPACFRPMGKESRKWGLSKTSLTTTWPCLM